MAALNPVSTTMRLKLSGGMVNGKEVTQSVSINGIDVNIKPDDLLAISQAFGSLAALPVIETRKNDNGIVVE